MWSDLRKSEGDSLIENIILTKKVGVGGVGEIEWFRNRKIFGFGGFFLFLFFLLNRRNISRVQYSSLTFIQRNNKKKSNSAQLNIFLVVIKSKFESREIQM